MKIFEIEARINGSYWIPDYKCPARWRGSGVYDREVSCTIDITAEVIAATEERAQALVDEFDYGNDKSNPWAVGVDCVDILDVVCKGDIDNDGEESIDVSYGDCKDKHPEQEPDPDEIYDRRRDDRGTGDI